MMDKREKYNWDEIQKFYDNDNSLRDVTKKFGCAMATMTKAVKNGKLKTRDKNNAMKIAKIKYPQKHSDETREKISKIRKQFIKDDPDKVPYRLYHYSRHMPYTEKYFIELFKNENIDLKYHLDVGVYQLDFYKEDIKLCVEIDGNQHFYDKRIMESDIRRTEYLESLGWKVFRIRWSDYQKKKYEEKEQVVEYIKNLIEIMGRKQK